MSKEYYASNLFVNDLNNLVSPNGTLNSGQLAMVSSFSEKMSVQTIWLDLSALTGSKHAPKLNSDIINQSNNLHVKNEGWVGILRHVGKLVGALITKCLWQNGVEFDCFQTHSFRTQFSQ